MALQVTNTIASSALRNQTVKITLSASEAVSKLPLIVKGQSAGIVSSGVLGTVASVDYFGNSFKITPNMPVTNLSSTSSPGVLAVSELININ